ncbi:signal peptide protein [Noviherbaspirillum autotrophicum]|uniref:Signal peptide protein n=2 Tax=Noviherbaspirillum autotrophicum TaxID=709839 RepID=A0A0C1Y9I5_9BURK|nr:signal peptide protein [Noviherbaspirillum autotrophicum]
MVRLGMQWKWENKWWQSNGSHVSGYWDMGLAHWRERRFQNVLDKTQNLTSIGITPVFRLQSDSLTGPYGEFGIGVHYLSELYDNNGRQLSTRFQFGDRIGAGYVFRNKLDLGLMIEHFSNGGVKEPNDGVNFAVVRVRYPF